MTQEGSGLGKRAFTHCSGEVIPHLPTMTVSLESLYIRREWPRWGLQRRRGWCVKCWVSTAKVLGDSRRSHCCFVHSWPIQPGPQATTGRCRACNRGVPLRSTLAVTSATPEGDMDANHVIIKLAQKLRTRKRSGIGQLARVAWESSGKLKR